MSDLRVWKRLRKHRANRENPFNTRRNKSLCAGIARILQTIAQLLRKHFPSQQVRFSLPLKPIMATQRDRTWRDTRKHLCR